VSAHAHPYPVSPEDTFVAQVERAQLCDLFDEVGPDAPTLSGSWDAHHLAAHLVAREGTPLGVVLLMRPKVGDEEVERLVGERDFASLVDEIREGPPRMSVFGTDLTDKAGNGLEFFIHHEDVRRTRAGFDRELARDGLLAEWKESNRDGRIVGVRFRWDDALEEERCVKGSQLGKDYGGRGLHARIAERDRRRELERDDEQLPGRGGRERSSMEWED